MDDFKGTVSSRTKRTDAHVKSETVTVHIKLARVQIRQNPSPEKGK